MFQIYKVFVNNFFILITDSIKTKNNHLFESVDSIPQILKYLIENDYNLDTNIVFKCTNPSTEFNCFKKHFKYIKAAGGLIQNRDKNILMIYKNKVWDLPKGKLEKGESALSAAIREVKEETGINHVNIVSEPFFTYHIYLSGYQHSYKQIYLKETRWFQMEILTKQNLNPQFEEGIQRVEWFSRDMVKRIKTYDSIKLVLKKFVY